MKRKWILLVLTCFVLILVISCVKKDDFPVLKGPYLGQKPPGMTPELFAPGIITTEFHEHSSPAFSPDGSEVFWSVFINFWGPQVILTMRLENGRWTRPEVASFSGQYTDGNPCFSKDGNKLYFESDDGDLKISFRKNDASWTLPKNLSERMDFTGGQDRFPLLSNDGQYLFFVSSMWLGPQYFDKPLTLEEVKVKARSVSNGLGNVYWVDAKIIDKLRPEKGRGLK
jgi:hypothetical protein